MIDVGIITGSGIYEMPGEPQTRMVETVETRFGEVEVAVSEVGPWTVGAVSRHRKGHHHLPHTIPHRANLAALKQLGARAILATTVVGAVGPDVPLGRPILFDDLFFPENRLPDGEACTMFPEPGEAGRGHLIQTEPFAPRLRRRTELAAGELGLETTTGGVYGHVNGPRFNTAAEIRWLAAAGVGAVSQTCGPETVLAGELEIPYALVGFPVNNAIGDGSDSEQSIGSMVALSADVLPRLLLRTVETLQEEDMTSDHGYIYRVEGGIG
jgi:purine nucleoside phosphorylase